MEPCAVTDTGAIYAVIGTVGECLYHAGLRFGESIDVHTPRVDHSLFDPLSLVVKHQLSFRVLHTAYHITPEAAILTRHPSTYSTNSMTF